jgi:histidyl-tRNA synthetase
VKRYVVGKTYRRNERGGGGHPLEEVQAQYDVVYDSRHALPEVLEGEVVWLAGQVIKALGPKMAATPYILRLNNAHLSNNLLELLETPAENRRDVLRVLEIACSTLPLSGKQLGGLIDNIAPPLPKATAEKLKSLVATLLGGARGDPFSVLDALARFMHSLPVTQSVLGDEVAQDGPSRPAVKPRRELKRLKQVIKAIFDAAAGLEALLNFLHALGMLAGPSVRRDTAGVERSASGGWGSAADRLASTAPADVRDASIFARSPSTPSGLEHQTLDAAKAWLSTRREMTYPPGQVLLDLGLWRRKSHYNSGLIFQVIVPPLEKEDSAESGGGPSGMINLSREDTPAKVVSERLRFLRYCVAEGGRYDSLILEHRTPAQYASPMVVAVGLTVAVEKLTSMMVTAGLARPASAAEAVLGDARRALAGSCTPEALIASGSSGLNVTGIADRLLVASTLWGCGIRADYLAQDLWGRHGGGADLSVEDLTLLCLSLGVPFLILVKAHTLRDQQMVKVRSVFEASVPDQLVALVSLGKHLLDRLHRNENYMVPPGLGLSPHTPGAPHHHHHHHHHHGHHAHGTGVEVALTSLDQRGSSFDKKKVYKEHSALERKVKSHLEAMMGHPFGGPSGQPKEPVKVLVADVPYTILKQCSSAYLVHGRAGPGMEEFLREHAHFKRPLKHLLDALQQMEDEDLLSQSRSTSTSGGKGSKGGSSMAQPNGPRLVFIYSLPDDLFDVLPLHAQSHTRRVVTGFTKSGGGHHQKR